MSVKNQIYEIKKNLESSVGCKVKLKTKSGRKRYEERTGIIDCTYPSVFTVKLNGIDNSRTVSYSYIDILTKTVELLIWRENNLVRYN